MGLIAGYLAFKGEASQPWRLFVMTGILGGYTTFSALLARCGAAPTSAANSDPRRFMCVGSVVLSIAGLFAGLALVRQFT